MATRRKFVQQAGLLSAGVMLQGGKAWALPGKDFATKRPPLSERNFTSEAVEATIQSVKAKIANPELSWLFENCFPNTLDTTVDFSVVNGKPDTYVITGDIDAMWLRDSTAQVWPYLPMIKQDKKLQQLVHGLINRQVQCILLDPYANAFFKDYTRESEWKKDLTTMKPGIHERKWEIDSLCYPIRLAWHYWKTTGDTKPFDSAWVKSVSLTLQTFTQQQRKDDTGPYTFQRTTAWATDGVPLAGYGYPVKPVGLICSMFRPSDDATIYPFLIPSNYFAVVSLRQAADMLQNIAGNASLANQCNALADEVAGALQQHAAVQHKAYGNILAYEVNGFGSHNLMDDANVPSLLSLPYLGALPATDPLYAATRKYILSTDNPFFWKGKAAEGIGGPHAGMHMIWPMSITMRGLTSTDANEIKKCLQMLTATHGGTGFMHESFHKDDASKFTRKWFAWANTLFGEFVLQVADKHPDILQNTGV